MLTLSLTLFPKSKPISLCPGFVRSPTDLIATKLFSRSREEMFQQDGAHVLTSKTTTACLDAHIKHYIQPEDWPPNSQDLTPIENVMSIMATAIYANPEPQSLQTSKHHVRNAWKSVSLSTLSNLIGSMSN